MLAYLWHRHWKLRLLAGAENVLRRLWLDRIEEHLGISPDK